MLNITAKLPSTASDKPDIWVSGYQTDKPGVSNKTDKSAASSEIDTLLPSTAINETDKPSASNKADKSAASSKMNKSPTNNITTNLDQSSENDETNKSRQSKIIHLSDGPRNNP